MKYEIIIFFLSIKWMFRQNLGNKVRYNGKVYTIVNGVKPLSWDLRGEEGRISAPRKDCRLVLSPSNIYRSYKNARFFYRGYWLDIWKNQGIKSWMKQCNIW